MFSDFSEGIDLRWPWITDLIKFLIIPVCSNHTSAWCQSFEFSIFHAHALHQKQNTKLHGSLCLHEQGRRWACPRPPQATSPSEGSGEAGPSPSSLEASLGAAAQTVTNLFPLWVVLAGGLALTNPALFTW